MDGKDVSFWVLLEGALGEVLTPAETASLITKMKRGMNDVPSSLTLEDLDAAAAAIL
eukprot:gene19282-21924_t